MKNCIPLEKIYFWLRWPRGFVASLAIYSAVFFFVLLVWTFGNARREAKFGHNKDQGEYVALAKDFKDGHFLTANFKPHRHPLYPALLVPVLALAPDNVHWLGAVNGVVGLLAVGLTYFFVFRAGKLHGPAACISILLATNFFFIKMADMGIVTEPTYILMTLCAVWLLADYCSKNKLRHLVAGSVFLGLAFMTRPNGILLLVGLLATLFVKFCSSVAGGIRLPACLLTWVRDSIVAALVFAVVASPLLWVKSRLYGNPLMQGKIMQYMWNDDYEMARSKKAAHSLSEYVSAHGWESMVRRAATGLAEVFFIVPLEEEVLPILYITAFVGVTLALGSIQKSRAWPVGPLIFIFCVVQMLPLAWTAISNPTHRIPYAAILPFLLFFGAHGLIEIYKRQLATTPAR